MREKKKAGPHKYQKLSSSSSFKLSKVGRNLSPSSIDFYGWRESVTFKHRLHGIETIDCLCINVDRTPSTRRRLKGGQKRFIGLWPLHSSQLYMK
jgi:hypothetical protein